MDGNLKLKYINMTDLELVKETIKYYTENLNRRATVKEGESLCQYKTEDGRMCAVGRLIDPDKLLKTGLDWHDLNEGGGVDNIEWDLEQKGFTINQILKDEYANIDFNTLADLQDFHDLEILSINVEDRIQDLLHKYEARY